MKRSRKIFCAQRVGFPTAVDPVTYYFAKYLHVLCTVYAAAHSVHKRNVLFVPTPSLPKLTDTPKNSHVGGT